MGQRAHDFLDVENTCRPPRPGAAPWQVFGVALDERPGGFGIGRVAGLDGHDVPAQAPSAQYQVANDVQNLMPDEFIGISEGFLAEHAVSPGDYGVFDASALDESLVHERLDVFVENEGACGGNFLLVEVGSDFGAQVLGEAAVRTDLGAGDAELGVRQDRDDGFPGLDHDRLPRFEEGARSVLLDDASLLDHAHVGRGAAIADGRLVGVHFDEGIVDTHAGQRGEHVLNGMNLYAAFDQRRGALHRFDVFDPGFDQGSSGRSERLNLKPWLGGAGWSVRVTFSPVCRAVPAR